MNKSKLAIILSKLKGFEDYNLSLEQYQTESDAAADVLWDAFMKEDIEGKIIGDFGCGNGILGIGALILGARKVRFVDADKKILEITKENLKNIEKELGRKFNFEIFNVNVNDFDAKLDVVFQNPPFGVKREHADRGFLESAFRNGRKIYSFHKIESKKFIEAFSNDNGFDVLEIREFKLPLKRTLEMHKKRIYYVDIGVWILEKNN